MHIWYDQIQFCQRFTSPINENLSLLPLYAIYIEENMRDQNILPSLPKPTMEHNINLLIGHPTTPMVQQSDGIG
jgi:hypothetical protein